jgi:nucleotidyltransferase substrate binding protein (TIGR01987 family)
LREVLGRDLTDEIIRDSAIQRFEFTLDIAWKVVKTYLYNEKGIVVRSPKEALREAYKQGIIPFDNDWIVLVDARNETVHTYNQKKAEEIAALLPHAVELFEQLLESLG